VLKIPSLVERLVGNERKLMNDNSKLQLQVDDLKDKIKQLEILKDKAFKGI